MRNLSTDRLPSLPGSLSPDVFSLPADGAAADSISLQRTAHAGYYYRIHGRIFSVDPAASDIHFQVNLPVHWNGKMLQYGGGGFNGAVISGEYQLKWQRMCDPTPLEQGYATFGSDSGHTGTVMDCSFALVEEELQNFAHQSLKKVLDAAVQIVFAAYGEKPEKVYFAGGSNGGREALKAVQRYPDSYDGAVCMFPAVYMVPLMLANDDFYRRISRNENAGWIDPETYEKVTAAVMRTCDCLDGLQDGIVSDLAGAGNHADEIWESVSDFLTAAQLKELKKTMQPYPLPYEHADGIKEVPVRSIFTGAPLISRTINLYGPTPGGRDGYERERCENAVRYLIAQDETYDTDSFRPEDWKERIREVSALIDASDTDLDAYFAKGGKLILMHGTADQLITVKSSIDYYERLLMRYGKRDLEQNMRFYLVPGYGHSKGGPFQMGADMMKILDDWVCGGKAPDEIIMHDENMETYGRIRPLYPYPDYAGFAGGDPDLASVYIRTRPGESL